MKQSIFSSPESFDAALNMARYLAPSTFANSINNSINNVLIALELARAMDVPVPTILANICLDSGQSSRYFWRGPFVIALINRSGGFDKPLEFEFRGSIDQGDLACRAVAYKGERRIEIDWIELSNVSEETFYANETWARNPRKMLRFSAAAEFGRLYCGELLFGMTAETDDDIVSLPTAQPATADVGTAPAAARNTDGSPETSVPRDKASEQVAAPARKPVTRRKRAGALPETSETPAAPAPTPELATPPRDGVEAAAAPTAPTEQPAPVEMVPAVVLSTQSGNSIVLSRDQDDDDVPRAPLPHALQRARALIPPPSARRPEQF